MTEIGKLYDANERWKDEIITGNSIWKDEIKQHFDLGVENIRSELVGANTDKIENHNTRIGRLESHLGLVGGGYQ